MDVCGCDTSSCEIDVQGVRGRRREWRGREIERRWSGGRREDFIYAHTLMDSKRSVILHSRTSTSTHHHSWLTWSACLPPAFCSPSRTCLYCKATTGQRQLNTHTMQLQCHTSPPTTTSTVTVSCMCTKCYANVCTTYALCNVMSS